MFLAALALLAQTPTVEYFPFNKIPPGYSCDYSSILTSNPPQYRCWKESQEGSKNPWCPNPDILVYVPGDYRCFHTYLPEKQNTITIPFDQYFSILLKSKTLDYLKQNNKISDDDDIEATLSALKKLDWKNDD